MRLFLALELPDGLREAIAAWQRGFDDPALRPVPAANLHMTLVFLGQRDPHDLDAIAEAAFSRVDSPAPVIEIDPEPVGRPRGKRPRLFALQARSPAAGALQAQVVAGLADAELNEPRATESRQRTFWPHLTVARVRPAKRGSRGPAVVERPPGPVDRTYVCRATALVRLTLFRSQTRPEGAVYEPMAELELPPAETER